MTDSPPRIENTPGLTWRLRRGGWEARWRPRKDIVKAGYAVRSCPLWLGLAPEPDQITYIQTMCRRLQDEMLEWSRGGALLKFAPANDGTLGAMVDQYRTHKYSTYQKLRYHTRVIRDRICDRLQREHGGEPLKDMNAIAFITWHDSAKGSKNYVGAAQSVVAMLRTVIGFGATILEDEQCKRLRDILHGLRFEGVGSRKEKMTVEQVEAVRRVAHATGRHSLALAQAFAFECTLRQKDVIGEYVPLSEPPLSDYHVGNDKWLRGLQWQEIDDNLVLRHMTSKKQKPIECDLRHAPMVMEELAFLARINPAKFSELKRSDLPERGPIVIYEISGVPYEQYQFRKQWRYVANKAGVPKEVHNMDSRSGAISEAIAAGAKLEHVRHTAAHSNISQTQKYDRAQAEATSNVMQMRVASRNKGTS
jgi:hypothetical protein